MPAAHLQYAVARLPGSKMIPAAHALRSMLCLKLWSVERRSQVMPHVADEGLGLLAGLNRSPKRSFLFEYSSPIGHRQVLDLLAAYHDLGGGRPRVVRRANDLHRAAL